MNITILCHYAWPELCAPAARLKEMAETWINEGHKVTLVTNFPNHPKGVIFEEYKDKKFLIEYKDKIKFIRCNTYAIPNSGMIKKTMSHLIFTFNTIRQAKKHLKGTDIIIVSSPPLFTGIAAWYLSKRLQCKYIIEVRDLWPAIFVELGILKNKIAIKCLELFELFLYKKSVYTVSLTNSFAKNIIRRSIPPKKVFVIPNGVNLDFFKSKPKNKELFKNLGLDKKFVVLYIGTHGISQNLFSIVKSAEKLKENNDIAFLFVGEGADKNKLKEMVSNKKLNNVHFLPSQPKDKVLDFYNSADICLVPLKNIPLFETFIPSKMFEIMGTGSALLASVSGEAKNILEESNGGAAICSPDNSDGIAKKILYLQNNPALLKSMKEKAHKFVSENFDRKQLALKYLKYIEKAVKKK